MGRDFIINFSLRFHFSEISVLPFFKGWGEKSFITLAITHTRLPAALWGTRSATRCINHSLITDVSSFSAAALLSSS